MDVNSQDPLLRACMLSHIQQQQGSGRTLESDRKPKKNNKYDEDREKQKEQLKLLRRRKV